MADILLHRHIDTAAQRSSARRTPKSIIARSPRSCNGNLHRKKRAPKEKTSLEIMPTYPLPQQQKKDDTAPLPPIYLSIRDRKQQQQQFRDRNGKLSFKPTELIHAGDGIRNRSLLFLRGAMSFPNSSTQMGWDETHPHPYPYPYPLVLTYTDIHAHTG